MKKLGLILIIVIVFSILVSGCCTTYNGYGRYTLTLDCEKVVIDGVEYQLTPHDGDFVIGGHTIYRGIYRKTLPWLYVHQIYSDSVDVTFDQGSKDIYPLYTGSSASIFDVYAHPWEMTRSTNAAFADNYWLVSHRWSDSGIYFDLQQCIGGVTDWALVREDIFVSSSGVLVDIPEIHTTVAITSFDTAGQTAMVVFTAY